MTTEIVVSLALAVAVISFISGIVVMWYLRPKKLSVEELSEYQIHPDIPSLFKVFNKTRIQYNQVGAGPDLILLHGIGASTFIWRRLIPLLKEKYRVTAIDMPGFGRSQKVLDFDLNLDSMSDFLVNFLSDIGIEKFDIVGSSMGGAIALWIAKKYPAKCGRVLTIAAATHKSLLRYPTLGLKILTPLHFFINKKTMLVAVRNVIKQKDLITDELVNGYLLPFRDRGEAWRSFLSAMAIVGDPRMPQELQELNSHATFRNKILWGDQDSVVPKWVQDELKQVLPRSEFEILPGLGHHPFEDDPEKVSMIIQKFFD